jgi:hypothetical protein
MFRKIVYYMFNYIKMKRWFEKICNVDEYDEILIIGQPGIGDILISATFIPYYISVNSGKKLVVCGERNSFVLKELGLNSYCTVSDCFMKSIRIAYARNPLMQNIINDLVRLNKLKILDTTFYMKTAYCYKLPSITVIDAIKCISLGLGQDIQEYTFPKINLEYDVAGKFGIKAPFIIINPFSNSAIINNLFWEKLVEKISQDGIDIYCNVFGNEKPIKGTKELKCTVQEFYALSSRAKYILSIRTGLMDYIMNSCKNMVVIYDRLLNYYAYSLSAWKGKTKLAEVLYINDFETIDKVLIECSKFTEENYNEF